MRTFYAAGDGPHHHYNVYDNLLSVDKYDCKKVNNSTSSITQLL